MALADATVRVILDVSRFDRDLQAKVASSARKAGRQFESEFTKTTRAAAKRWAAEFGDESNKAMSGAGNRAGTTFGGAVRRSARPTGRLTGRDLGEQIRTGLVSTTAKTGRLYTRGLMTSSVTFAGQRLGQRLGRSIVDNTNVTGIGQRLRRQIEADSGPHVLAAARTVASRFGNAMGTALSGASISRFGALVAGVAGLVSEGIQLAAALEPGLQIVGALPAVASVATASISVLAVAFRGMGDALGQASEGGEKFEQSMENLAPAAQAVVREFQQLTPGLERLRREVQQAFFDEVAGDLTRLGALLTGPVQRGMTEAGSAAGRMAHGLTDALTQARSAGAIEEIFQSSANAFDQMNVPVQRLTTGMLDWIRATLPAFDQLIATLGAGTERFGAFLSRAAASGQAMAWVNEAITTLSQLSRVAVSAGRLVGTIFDAAREAGRSYLTNLNNALIATRQFLAVGEGRTALVSIFEGIHEVVQALAEPLRAAVVSLGQITRVAGSVSQALSAGLAAAIRGIGTAIENAGPGLTRFAEAVGSALSEIGDVLPSVGESLGRILSAAAPLVGVFGVVAQAGAALLSVLSSLPAPILTIITAFLAFRALGVPNLLTQIQQRAAGTDGVFSRMSGAVSNLTTTYRTNLASLTDFRTHQQFLNQSLTSGIPPVTGFGAALGGLSDRARAAGGAIGGSLLRGAQSLIGALGGGIGIALTAASVLIGMWADEQAKADQAVAEHNQRVRALGSTLDKVTGSITNATRAQAQQSFASSDLADSAKALSLSIDQVADAATGNEVSQRRMLEQLRNSARGAIQNADAFDGLQDSANNLGLSTDVIIDAMLGNADAITKVNSAVEQNGGRVDALLGYYGQWIPDQMALGNAVNKTADDLANQAAAIQQANAQYGPAARLADDLAEAMGVLADNSSTAADKARALDTALRLLNGGTITLADAQKATADAIASGRDQMQTMIDKYNIAGKSASQLGISTQEFAQRQTELGHALFDSSGQLNFASERARGLYDVTKQLRQSTLDQTAAIIDNAQKTGGDMAQAHKRAADLINASRAQIVQWATDAGFGAEAGEQLADMMGLIPENVKVALEMQNVPAILSQLSEIKGDIELLPDKKSLRLDSNARGMKDELEDLGFIVEDIPGSKDIKITPNTSEATAALQQFILQMITMRNPEMKVNADTSAAELSAEQLQEFIKLMPAVFQPGLNAEPVIAEWQNLLLGPLNTPPGTPTVTPSVDGGRVQNWFDTYLGGLVAPGTPKITPGVDPGAAIEGMKGMENALPIPFIAIVPIIDGKPAYDQMNGLMFDIAPAPGDPKIQPGLDGSVAQDQLPGMLGDLIPQAGQPEITPGVNAGPASLQMDKLLDLSPEEQPRVIPTANTAPAQGQIQSLILGINQSRTTGPTVNANTALANAQLALLLALINRSQGNVRVGANTGPGVGGVNSLVSYANSRVGSVGVFAATGGAYAQVNELVRYINSRTATVSVNTSGSVQAAEGGIFKFFAGGGFNPRGGMRSMPANRAEIVPAKTMRVIGDRAQGDEAFIPLVNSARSRAILQTASSRMGFDLVPRQQQQQQATTASTTVEAGAIVVNAPYSDPFLVARAVVNELTREAVT